MSIRNLVELKAVMPRHARLIGLDIGEKTIGMAVCDPGFSVASPIGTIRRTKFTQDAQELARAMKDRDVRGLVIGLPVNMDGTEGPRCESVREFARNLLIRPELLSKIEPEIAFWDERLSTSAVDRMMIEWDMTRKRRDEVVDKMAAAYILQGALDYLKKAEEQDEADLGA
ncbi:Holliday junction resolvase RuvX [Niveispirillum sp.]|uniref:Holliday junction resolvase RuvX n=1 Tax=Niveispirillum sp. TaxID=1917217 RepID=UPI001B3ECB67|nr:Holliday junction resolvase RuvX [Niveispirillum sp.]MBP7339152.1 Holliday junction resolvase RuvX [Niveispirillum sp.]